MHSSQRTLTYFFLILKNPAPMKSSISICELLMKLTWVVAPSLKDAHIVMCKSLEGGFFDVCLIGHCPKLTVSVMH